MPGAPRIWVQTERVHLYYTRTAQTCKIVERPACWGRASAAQGDQERIAFRKGACSTVSELTREIVDRLRRAPGAPISGERLGADLGVSRAAIWKGIAHLRQSGFRIDAVPRCGYVLVAEPDAFTPAAIVSRLTTRTIGRAIEWHEAVGSTNDLAWERRAAGMPSGLVIGAETQTNGRGRRGRRWASPHGLGLWFSVLLAPPLSGKEAPVLTLFAAVAAARAVRRVTGLPAGIKWPNDILVDEKKVCGILVESSAELGRLTHAVVGIGLNVAVPETALPPEARAQAASLSTLADRPLGRADLLVALLEELDLWYHRLVEAGPGPVLEAAGALSLTLGRPVRVHGAGCDWDGEATGLADDGALLVTRPDGAVEPVYASEVSLRHA